MYMYVLCSMCCMLSTKYVLCDMYCFLPASPASPDSFLFGLSRKLTARWLIRALAHHWSWSFTVPYSCVYPQHVYVHIVWSRAEQAGSLVITCFHRIVTMYSSITLPSAFSRWRDQLKSTGSLVVLPLISICLWTVGDWFCFEKIALGFWM